MERFPNDLWQLYKDGRHLVHAVLVRTPSDTAQLDNERMTTDGKKKERKDEECWLLKWVAMIGYAALTAFTDGSDNSSPKT